MKDAQQSKTISEATITTTYLLSTTRPIELLVVLVDEIRFLSGTIRVLFIFCYCTGVFAGCQCAVFSFFKSLRAWKISARIRKY